MALKSEEMNKRKREAELVAAFGEMPESKKPFILSLIHDFVEIEARCAALEGLPTFEIDARNTKRQRKLPAHDMLKEWQQRKTEVTRALLRADETTEQEESPLMKVLAKYETR